MGRQPTHLTFDCYGTLIDWEQGILDAVLPVLVRRGVVPDPIDVLRRYVEIEAREEPGRSSRTAKCCRT